MTVRRRDGERDAITGKEGGNATKAKYGVEHYRRMGRILPKPGSRPRGKPTRTDASERAWAEMERRSGQ